jgi:hypothetical protein
MQFILSGLAAYMCGDTRKNRPDNDALETHHCFMRILRSLLLLALLSILPGCLTTHVVDSVRNGSYKFLPDRVEKIEGAKLTGDDHLLIFVEGRLTNSTETVKMTLSFPLTDRKVIEAELTTSGSNQIHCVKIASRRDSITRGWSLKENSAADADIPLGQPLPVRWIEDAWNDPSRYKPLPGTTRTLYLLRQSSEATHDPDFPPPVEFVYVDITDGRKFYLVILSPESRNVRASKAAYILIPLTVPVDAATLPILFPFIVMYGLSHHG